MGFVKILKNKAYSKRYQTKFRRRRQGKTDYYARKRLVVNDKDKYDTKKYRLVVRFTNRRVITSVVYSTIKGDMTVCMADSKELVNHGLKCGLTNYAAAYATGLLLARRLLKDKSMDTTHKGQETADGKYYNIEDAGMERRPFKAFLDVGLVRTTTGNRVFGAMKGAVDGGLLVPHSEQRWPGFKIIKAEVQTNKRGKKIEENADKAKSEFNAKVHYDHIMGGHVQSYYDSLKKDNQARFKSQFSKWTKCLEAAKVKNMQELYTKVHAAIRAKPEFTKKKALDKPVRKVISKKPNLQIENGVKNAKGGNKYLRQFKCDKKTKDNKLK